MAMAGERWEEDDDGGGMGQTSVPPFPFFILVW
jgi:hypothetical protein